MNPGAIVTSRALNVCLARRNVTLLKSWTMLQHRIDERVAGVFHAAAASAILAANPVKGIAVSVDVEALRAAVRTGQPPFSLNKIGHVVLMVADLERSVEFYTGLLGFRVSDIYGDDMMPGGMVFMRCNTDHHGVALVGGASGPENRRGLHHLAFEVGTLDEVFRARAHLRERGTTIVFEGRRRAGVQIAVEFLDPDGHNLEIYWGLDQIGTDAKARPAHEWRGAKTLEEAVANPPPGQVPIVHDKSLLAKKT